MADQIKTTDEQAKLLRQFDNLKYFLQAEATQGYVPDAWKTPEEKAKAEMESDHTARAQEIAEALRAAWGFDMRFSAGVRWLARVIAELKKEAIDGR